MSFRLRVAAVIAMLAFLAGACGQDAAGFSPPRDLLQPADLPSSPAKTTSTTEPPSIAAWCEGRFESIYGPAFKTIGVEYTDVDGATVVSTRGREPSPTLDRQRLEQISDVLSRCAATTPERGLELLDLGPGRVGFQAPAYPAAQAAAGRVGIAEVDGSYVLVAVIGDPDAGSPDLEQLLDAALDRATGA